MIAVFGALQLFVAIIAKAQLAGCTDPLAVNYNQAATINDGSCMYPAAAVSPDASFILSSAVIETSGLIAFNNQLWTHNDNEDVFLHQLDTANGNLLSSTALPGTINIDWEEISQDADYVYIGDFGNNANGNRTNLKIYKIDKLSLLSGTPFIETIEFSYANQFLFNPAGPNNTDFDCEAMIVSTDSIYLFTKQWITNETSVYSLPKTAGIHTAKLLASYNVEGLITGASYFETQNLVVLCGYSATLQPFLFLLYDFQGKDFFGGNKRKISISLPFHQVEGIAGVDGLKYYISNEKFVQPPINIPQKLHILDLGQYLEDYLSTLYNISLSQPVSAYVIYPNPANEFIIVQAVEYSEPDSYIVTDFSDRIVLKGNLSSQNNLIDIRILKAGIYFVKIGEKRKIILQFVKN